MCKSKKNFFFVLTGFIFTEIVCLYLGLITLKVTASTLFFLFICLLSTHIIQYRKAKAVDIEIEEYEKKINTLSSEIKNKQGYLNYLPQGLTRLNFFKKITEQLIKQKNLEDIYQFLSTEIKGGFNDFDAFLLYTTKQGKLRLTCSYRKLHMPSIKNKEGDILDNWVLKHNQGLIVEDISQDFRFDSEHTADLKSRKITSLIISPMFSRNKIIGILRIESSKKKNFNFEDLRILSVIADLASVTIDRAKIFRKVQELAIKDGMTGLYRKGYFLTRLKEEIKRASLNQSKISLIMVDIDHFKLLNDKYGHIVGDFILKRLAKLLNQIAGSAGNIICRFGGEEFIILAVSENKEEVNQTAQKLRRTTENTHPSFRRKKITFTISIGVATFPADAITEQDLIEKADKALYEAKKSGRNRVCSAS